MAVIQTLLGEEGRYDSKDIIGALEELGKEAERPDAVAYLEDKYKPKVYQPTDSEEDMWEDVDTLELGKEVARLHAQQEL